MHQSRFFSAVFALALALPLHAVAAGRDGAPKLEKLPYSGDVLMARALRSGRIPLAEEFHRR